MHNRTVTAIAAAAILCLTLPACTALQGNPTAAEWEARALAAETASKAAATAAVATVPPPLGEVVAAVIIAAGATVSAYFHGKAKNNGTTPKPEPK